MRTFRIFSAMLTAAVLASGCSEAGPSPLEPSAELGARARSARIIRVIGTTGDLTAGLAELRSLLGSELNAGPGSFASGRREINWDGVPPALTNNDLFPSDFFNNTDPAGPAGRKRGAVFLTPGTGLRISDNDMADIDPSYASQFNAFSPARTFVQSGSNIMDIEFRIPGTNTPAVVNGFGAVFSDVDKPLVTALHFYDAGNRRIAVAYAPKRTDRDGFSLAGVVFSAPVVARVRMFVGEAALGAGVRDISSGGTHDLVVTDDFFYGEPQPLP